MKNKQSGFTLLEILLVVGIIAILAGIVIVAINPSKQLAQVRNTERKSDLKQVANAITQFYIDHSYYPASSTFPTTTLMPICPTGASTSPAAGFDCEGMLNLSELVPTYIVAIPNDPATTTVSGYSVVLVNNNPAVYAPLAELGVTISVGNVPVVSVPVVAGCGDLTPACGDPTNLNCWSGEVPDMAWGPNPSITGVSTNEIVSNGMCNTAILNAITPGEDDYPAADYCANLIQGGHSDWYLPSKAELWAGWETFGWGFDGFPSGYYWSSTEVSSYTNNSAFLLEAYDSGAWITSEEFKSGLFNVRCLR